MNKKAVVACVANEHHQIGGKMVADILELNGWDSYFLGANTPTPDLIDMISRNEPDIVGGQAFSWGGAEALNAYPNVSYVPSVQELELVIAGDTDET